MVMGDCRKFTELLTPQFLMLGSVECRVECVQYVQCIHMLVCMCVCICKEVCT